MEITINNTKENIKDDITLSELILIKNFTFKFLVTKVNGELVKKDNRDEVIIKNGDDVMVIHLISGG